MRFFLATFFSSILISSASAMIVFDVLPAGRHAVGLKHVSTGNISSSYGSDGERDEYIIREEFTADILKDVNEASEIYFEELKNTSPEAYEQFTFGEYQGTGRGRVEVLGFGIGRGITDRLTVYGAIGHYRGKVEFSVERTKEGNIPQVVETLGKAASSDEMADLLHQITSQFPDVNKELLQSIVVNLYEYEPLGDWSGKGFGDLELGMLYKLGDWRQYSLITGLGVNLPTGRVDNPDILQDIGFGDGQTDIWGEVHLTTKPFLYDRIQLGSMFRYVHQRPKARTLRVPESSEFPLTDQKAEFKEKLGDVKEMAIEARGHWNDWLMSYVRFSHHEKSKNKYYSDFPVANEIHALNSNTEVQVLTIGKKLSTIGPFFRNKFPLPLDFEVSAQSMLSGKNIPNYQRFDIEFKFFF